MGTRTLALACCPLYARRVPAHRRGSRGRQARAHRCTHSPFPRTPLTVFLRCGFIPPGLPSPKLDFASAYDQFPENVRPAHQLCYRDTLAVAVRAAHIARTNYDPLVRDSRQAARLRPKADPDRLSGEQPVELLLQSAL